MGNCDVAIENDLRGATEIVLSANRPQRVVDRTSPRPPMAN